MPYKYRYSAPEFFDLDSVFAYSNGSSFNQSIKKREADSPLLGTVGQFGETFQCMVQEHADVSIPTI